MLVLTRKPGEKITVGHDIEIVVVSIDRNQVRIGIAAPKDTRILRAELVPVATEPELELEPVLSLE